MSRYFFHIRNGDDIVPDLIGTILPDLPAVIARALKTARGILAREVLSGSMPMNKRVQVQDQHGAHVHDLPFVHAVSFKFNARYRHGVRQASFPEPAMRAAVDWGMI